MSYEYSRTNGSYSGLSSYHGNLAGREGKGKGRGPGGEGRGGRGLRGRWKQPSSDDNAAPPTSPFDMSRMLEQKSIQTAQRAENLENRGDNALATGQDTIAQGLFSRSNLLQRRADNEDSRAKGLRLPYADDPMVPKAIAQKADNALFDTPLKIADQAAPIPVAASVASVPTTAPASVPTATPATLPLTPPPILLPGVRMMMPPPMMMARGPMVGPPSAGPRMMAPMGPPPMASRISPANAAAATAALAASYFLFF